ncbi:uncharacterized protein LOC123015594 [Tribolium madens]|uniref:uncharacterized protein LOC123015594 n=1 Tax=Tribolium madens TaxID=41895 RepID=UPI001CF7540E|nr:uncharacterized protein LOC123015594 [Tribolium madens]
MVTRCVVHGCKSTSDSSKEKVSFFQVPKAKLKLWQKIVRTKHRPLTIKDRICEKHFKESDIIKEIITPLYSYKLDRIRLKPNALPSMLPIYRNYQLRSRKLTWEPPIKKIKLEQPIEFIHIDEMDKLETTPEEVFRSHLETARLKYNYSKHMTLEEYNQIVAQVSEAKKTKDDSKLSKYNVVIINGQKKLTATHPTDLQYYVHDDELFHILQHTHIALQHGNQRQMMTELKKRYKNIIGGDVATFIEFCPRCIRNSKAKDHKSVPMIFSKISSICHVNLLDYRAWPDGDFKYILVYHNEMTNFCQLKALKTNKPSEIAEHLVDIFTFVGAPTEMHTREKDSHFLENILKELKQIWPNLVIKPVKSNQHEILAEIKRIEYETKSIRNRKRWSSILPFIQFEKNKDISSGVRPYERLFGLVEPYEKTVLSSNIQKISKNTIVQKPETTFVDEENIGQICTHEPDEIEGDNEGIPRFFLPSFFKIPKPTRKKIELEKAFKKLTRNNTAILTKAKYKNLIKKVNTYRKLKHYDTLEIDGVVVLITSTTNGTGTIKYYVHEDELFDILHYTHINFDHASHSEMARKLKRKFENITNEIISTYLLLCPECKGISDSNTATYSDNYAPQLEIVGDIIPHNEMSSKCSINFLNFESQLDHDYKYVMVYVNTLTKFHILRPMKHKTSKEIADILLDIFTFLGVPSKIFTQESRLLWRAITKVRQLWPGFCLIVQIRQGIAPRMIDRELEHWMCSNKTLEWTKGLDHVQLMRNKFLNYNIEKSPFDALFAATAGLEQDQPELISEEEKDPLSSYDMEKIPQVKKQRRVRRKAPFKSLQTFVMSGLTSRCSVNLIDYHTKPDGHYNFIMVYQNTSTKFSILKPLKTKFPDEVAENLVDIFTLVGASDVVESYHGREFVRKLAKSVNHLHPNLIFEYNLTTYRNYKSVCSIEIEIQRWMLHNGTQQWTQALPFVQLTTNKSFDEEMAVVPFEAFFKGLGYAGREEEDVK